MPLFIRKRVDAEGKADGSQYMICTGSVSRDAKVGKTHKGEPKAGAGIRYEKGREFVNFVAYGEGAAVKSAALAEYQDKIHVVGVWTQRPYESQGEKKIWSEIRAEEVYFPERLMELQLLPINDLYRLLALLPSLEKLCAGEKPDVRLADAPQSAAGFQEIEDNEPLPWDAEDSGDDYELSI